MYGIAGVFQRMLRKISRLGPDSPGITELSNGRLGHRCLAIADRPAKYLLRQASAADRDCLPA